MAEGRLFHYRFNPADCYAEIDEMSIEERGRFLTKICRDLVKGESDNCFISGMIEEARKYIETKKLAGKKGGEAKSSSAKAVLSSAIAKPSTPLASSSSSSSTEAVTEQKQKQKKEPKTYCPSSDGRREGFEKFWEVFSYKQGKGGAEKSWKKIEGYNDNLLGKILDGAAREAKRRPLLVAQGRSPKWAQGWITERRWEDEIIDITPERPMSQREKVNRAAKEAFVKGDLW